MHHEWQPAFILHRRPYRETSLLLEVFTRSEGRIAMLAKGAKRGRGNRAALLQAFVPLQLCWTGRSDLKTLTDVEARGSPLHLSGPSLISAFYLNELIVRLLQPQDPYEELFAAYQQALQQLAFHPQRMQWSLRLFEKELLQELGYGLQLECEVGGGKPVQPGLQYCYDMQMQGPRPAGECDRHSGPRLGGMTLLALASGTLPEAQQLYEAKILLRAVLARHLGPRPLRSRELFRQTQAVY